MQLVNDCVIMYDTMKDKKIGIPEVIEKFGVPPDKVIEVQALIGDSTDNVPGVPGIGVKTAAQLIGEYGDLETLLTRAGEIKQEKRRQTLIDNADKARLSKRLVTLDDKVKLDVPLADLAVHEPDYKLLIAFLKAMEFNTLTRRVAEFSGVEAAEIEASQPSTRSPRDRQAGAAPSRDDRRRRDPSASPGLPLSGGGMAPKNRRPARPPPPTSRSRRRRWRPSAPRPRARRSSTARATRSCTSVDRLEAWVARARDIGVVAINAETVGEDPMQATLCGIALAVAPNEACYVPLAHRKAATATAAGCSAASARPTRLREDDALAALKPLLEDPGVLKIGQNLKFEWQLFAVRGIELRSHEDTMLMSYVLDAGRYGHGIDALAPRYFNHTAIDYNDVIGTGKAKVGFDCVAFDKAAPYVAEDADLALRLTQVLRPRMVAEHMTSVYETLERPLLPVLARMERRGISVDRQVLSRLSGEFAQRAAGLEAEVRELAGDPSFNPGSPKQLGDILFGKMGLARRHQDQDRPVGDRRARARRARRAGPRAAAEDPGMAADHQAEIDLHRRAAGLHQSRPPSACTPTTRWRRRRPAGSPRPSRTCRTSRSAPRKAARSGAPSSRRRATSSSPPTIRRSSCGCSPRSPTSTALRKAFRDGLDIHAMTASEMFGVPVKGMPGEIRRRAKAINFGIIYGISAFGLANQLGIAREEAGAYIKKYFERFPGIRDYMEETKAFAKQHGYVTTLFGRKCHYPEIKHSNASIRAFNERAAINARLQGSAADIIRRAMIRMDAALAKKKLNAQMLLQVHDELVFEVPEDEVDKTLPVVKAVMEDAPHPAVSLSVPLAVDARAADNWDEAH